MNQPQQRPAKWKHIQLAPNMREKGLFYELMEFCRQHGGRRCFVNWPEQLLREYLLFHLRNHTLVYLRPAYSLQEKYAARPILGVAIAWPEWLAAIRTATEHQVCVFDWRPVRPDADAIYLAEVITTNGHEWTPMPEGRRGILKALARELWIRWPQHRGKPICYHRERPVFAGTLRRGKPERAWECKRLDGRLTRWAGLPVEKDPSSSRQERGYDAVRKELVYG